MIPIVVWLIPKAFWRSYSFLNDSYICLIDSYNLLLDSYNCLIDSYSFLIEILWKHNQTNVFWFTSMPNTMETPIRVLIGPIVGGTHGKQVTRQLTRLVTRQSQLKRSDPTTGDGFLVNRTEPTGDGVPCCCASRAQCVRKGHFG